MQDFRNLDVWRKAHELVLHTYEATRRPSEHRFPGLAAQLRRAAASVPANIVEGCGHASPREFARFLQLALASAHEVHYHLLLAHDLAEIAGYIDWGPFFQTWDLAGPYPAILKDPVVGEEAVRVLSDGKRMLRRLIEGRWLTAHAVVGLYPANSRGDDIVLWRDD